MMETDGNIRKVAGILAGAWMLCSTSGAIADTPDGRVASQKTGTMVAMNDPSATAKPAAIKPFSVTQKKNFERNWGVEVIGIHPVSSGYMLNFRYRVIDPEKAKPLNDMKSKAYVIDNATGTRLAIPALENIGELRTGTEPKADRIYFMIFGNPGRLVKVGSSVSVVIGNFHVDNLMVN